MVQLRQLGGHTLLGTDGVMHSRGPSSSGRAPTQDAGGTGINALGLHIGPSSCLFENHWLYDFESFAVWLCT